MLKLHVLTALGFYSNCVLAFSFSITFFHSIKPPRCHIYELPYSPSVIHVNTLSMYDRECSHLFWLYIHTVSLLLYHNTLWLRLSAEFVKHTLSITTPSSSLWSQSVTNSAQSTCLVLIVKNTVWPFVYLLSKSEGFLMTTSLHIDPTLC